MTVRRIEMLLIAMTALFAATGVGLWIWQPPIPEPPAPAAPAISTPRASGRGVGTTASTNGDAGAVVSGNIFSSTRAAPRVRYTPPGSGNEPDAPPTGEPADAAMILDTPLPQVFGTMTGPAGATALIQSDSAGASGRLYREGDQVGQYRIVRITGSTVTVRGPGGRHELKVQARDGAER